LIGCTQSTNEPAPDIVEDVVEDIADGFPDDIVEDIQDLGDEGDVEASADEGVDAGPISCEPLGTEPTLSVELPLGETLFLEGDSYLSFGVRRIPVRWNIWAVLKNQRQRSMKTRCGSRRIWRGFGFFAGALRLWK